VFLVLDVEMVEHFPLFGFGEVRVTVFRVELALPHLDLVVFLTDQLDEVLVLIHEMGVLGQQKLNLLLQVIDLLPSTNLEDEFFVDGH
jgi:hypothetical protein